MQMQPHHEQSRAEQSRSIAAVPCSNQYRNVPACPPRLLPLVALFNVVFEENNLLVTLRRVPISSHLFCLPMTRGQQAQAGTTCLRRRVAVRVRQAGRVVRVPGSPATGGHVAVGKRNQSLVVVARTGAAVQLLAAALQESLC